MAADAAAQGGAGGRIVIQQPGKEPVALTNEQVIQIIQNLQSDVASRDKQIGELTAQLQHHAQAASASAAAVSGISTDGTIEATLVANDHNDILERYEQLLKENRELRRQLDGASEVM